MDTSEILVKVYELKDEIMNSNEYLELKTNEKAMEDNCGLIFTQYAKLQEEYNQAKRFEKYGSNAKEAMKKLYDFKVEMDKNPYIKSYNDSYKKMAEKLDEIEKAIFSGLIDRYK